MGRLVEVTTTEGRLRGAVAGEIAVFRGVPFAAPPVGPLRFRPPRPVEPWRGVREAFEDGPVCPQPPSRLARVVGDFAAEQGEDCLTLTIWAPLPLDRSHPVLVWFHGGGYVSGAGSLPWYSGKRLAREARVVVVGVNHRLGALGYLYHPALAPGNPGLLDQVAAINWVCANAAAFGGDADRITLMGQSAGAHSIACLLAMPSTRALVRRVVLLSTPFAMRAIPLAVANAHGDAFLGHLGIDAGREDALSRLQDLPVADLLAAQEAVMRDASRPGDPTPPFGPVAVGELPGGPAFDDAVVHAASGLDVLLGTTRDEMAAFYRFDPRLRDLRPDDLQRPAEELFGEAGRERIEVAKRYRPGAAAPELLSDSQTARYFGEGAARLATAVAAAGRRAWVYQFDWQSPLPGLGACHCIDLPFFFGTFDAFAGAPMLGITGEADEALSAVVRAALGRFVTTGDPNHDDLPHWPPFTADDPVVLHFDTVIGVGHARNTEAP